MAQSIRVLLDSKDGKIKIEAVSILEDLEEDFSFFREAASRRTSPNEVLTQKRYLRAALLTLFAYFEGVVNVLFVYELRRSGKDRESVQKFLYKRLSKKCSFLERIASLSQSEKIGASGVDKLKKLRNDIFHYSPGKDLKIFDGITQNAIDRAGSLIISWLATIQAELGRSAYDNTKDVIAKFRAQLQKLGVETKEIKS